MILLKLLVICDILKIDEDIDEIIPKIKYGFLWHIYMCILSHEQRRMKSHVSSFFTINIIQVTWGAQKACMPGLACGSARVRARGSCCGLKLELASLIVSNETVTSLWCQKWRHRSDLFFLFLNPLFPIIKLHPSPFLYAPHLFSSSIILSNFLKFSHSLNFSEIYNLRFF